MSSLIDSHTHLESFYRAGALEDVLARASEAGVERLVTIGTDPSDWPIYRDLAAKRPDRIAYTVGIHPCDVEADWAGHLEQAAGFFQSPVRPVAVGEIGLDRFHLSRDPEVAEGELARQKEAFRAQLALAARLDVPVVIHSRGAFAECVDLVDQSEVDWEKVVFHCFTEGPEAMRLLRERGGRGSFTGILTYRTADEVREAAVTQGLETLMLETDAPYLTPVPHRGKPNEPAFLQHTARLCADLFGISLEELGGRTSQNARDFYRLP